MTVRVFVMAVLAAVTVACSASPTAAPTATPAPSNPLLGRWRAIDTTGPRHDQGSCILRDVHHTFVIFRNDAAPAHGSVPARDGTLLLGFKHSGQDVDPAQITPLDYRFNGTDKITVLAYYGPQDFSFAVSGQALTLQEINPTGVTCHFTKVP